MVKKNIHVVKKAKHVVEKYTCDEKAKHVVENIHVMKKGKGQFGPFPFFVCIDLDCLRFLLCLSTLSHQYKEKKQADCLVAGQLACDDVILSFEPGVFF